MQAEEDFVGRLAENWLGKEEKKTTADAPREVLETGRCKEQELTITPHISSGTCKGKGVREAATVSKWNTRRSDDMVPIEIERSKYLGASLPTCVACSGWLTAVYHFLSISTTYGGYVWMLLGWGWKDQELRSLTL
jgi:hypothetical protein